MLILSVIFVWLYWISICGAYRFLGLFPLHGKSHFIMLEGLAKSLISKGHQIDVISPFPQKKAYPNYTDIAALQPPMLLLNNMTYQFMRQVLKGSNPVWAIGTIAGNELCEKHLGHPAIKKLVHDPPKDPPYDAVIAEVFGGYCFTAIANLLNVPLIGVSTTSMYPWLHDLIAQPENLAYMPNNCISLEHPMNFWQRIHNVLSTHYLKFYFHWVTRIQDDIVREHLGPNLPSVKKMNLALLLINSDNALNGIQSMTPAAVQIGGIHIREDDSPLPAELKKWMDDSKAGFIYFTFGSMMMIETFPRPILDIFYNSLRKITPVRVLMKVPNPEKLPSGLPKNIYLSAWMPQIKVLKHPNARAFITHGGLLSTMESVACGIPMIGIPLFADQFKNIEVYVTRKVALKLDLDELTEKNMDTALNTILYNPQYMENVKNLSKKFLDQPLSPVDIANYWIEYVIRYGADSLRSPAMDLAWWQLYLIDVVVFLLFCVTLIMIVIIAVAVVIKRLMKEMINADHHKPLRSKKVN